MFSYLIPVFFFQILLYKNLVFCQCLNRLVKVCTYSLLDLELFEKGKMVVVGLVVLCSLIFIMFMYAYMCLYVFVCECLCIYHGISVEVRQQLADLGLKSGYRCGWCHYSWSQLDGHVVLCI